MTTAVTITLVILLALVLASFGAGYYMFRFAVARRPQHKDYWDPDIPLWDTNESLTREDYETMNRNAGWIKRYPYETVYTTSADGLKLGGRLFEPEKTPCRGQYILCHGYRSHSIYDFSCVVKLLLDEGFSCLLIDLPLFLCSIQLITIPLAAFCKGKLREAALDFVMIFGILGGVLGTVGAAQNYSCYPVLSWDNVVSGITHCTAGFASLYIAISGMASMKKSNIPFTLGILTFFCIAAFVANELIDYNYMFLRAGDGTPYDILFNLVGGHPVVYPLCVVGLFFLYILGYYGVYFLAGRKKAKV